MEFLHLITQAFEKDWTSNYYMLLVSLVFADLILGFSRAITLHKFNSTIGITGIVKHVLILLIPLMIYPFIDELGYSSVANGIIAFLALSEGGSVLENWIAIGLPFKPEWREFFDDKKIEQKERYGTIHTEQSVPDEHDKKL